MKNSAQDGRKRKEKEKCRQEFRGGEKLNDRMMRTESLDMTFSQQHNNPPPLHTMLYYTL